MQGCIRINTGPSIHTGIRLVSPLNDSPRRIGGVRVPARADVLAMTWFWLGIALCAGIAASAQTGSTRDYIYLGSRLIAIEETAGGTGGEPVALSISSTRLTKEEKGFRLVVNGTNFNQDSVIRVNGEDRETAFVSSKRLSTLLSNSVEGRKLEILVRNSGGRTEQSNRATNHWETR